MKNGRMGRLMTLSLTAALALTGLVGLLSLGGSPARVRAASPIYVRTDGNDADCNGTVNVPYSPGAAPNCALATIQQGIYSVDAGGIVIVASGIYTAALGIDRDLTLQGAGPGSTIVDGNGVTWGFYVAADSNATIGDLTVRDCVYSYGGGIDNRGHLTVTNSIISGNATTPSGGDGAGILNLDGSLVISNSSIIGNAADRGGGGVFNIGQLTIINSDIVSNTAPDGGGVLNSVGTLTIRNASIRDNRAFGISAYGGGVFNAGTATLDRVTLSGNSARYTDTVNPGIGGAIHTQETMTLTNCTISGNVADFGGAISNSGDKLVIASTTIASNRIAADTAGPGGISNHGAMTTTNTIIAQNDNANCLDEGRIYSAGHNLESADDCGFDATGDLVNTDPRLGPLQDNGGLPTSSGQAPWTHALQGGSPTIDAGTGVDCPTTDQRGVARPVDGDLDETATCDIGAYEFEPIEVYLPLAIRQS